jgi:hypothetical protein
MEDKALCVCLGCGCITILVAIALLKGIDGVIYTAGVVAISAIVGYMFGKEVGRKGDDGGTAP